MNAAASQEQIDAARAYEALFVPALFGQWTARVADSARLRSGQRVLDVACGTGALAREAAARVGQTGHVAGLDPDPGMLAVAREVTPTVEWKRGVADALPFPDRSFDAVISQFGLMFFPDRPRAVREMLRVLKPGGRLVVAVWDALANIPAYAAEVAVLERHAGTAAADALRAPFALGNREDLVGLFVDAGASSVDVETHPGTAAFPSLRVMIDADLQGWLPVMGVTLSDEMIDRIRAEATEALARFVTTDGRVEFSAPAHVVAVVK